jgi:glycosyltransferase involved in cell wall biosynthesis
MTEPQVSAIITAYNSQAYIADAISSVLSQSRPVNDIVVIDDGSTDETAKVVSGFRTKGVRYVYQPNQGPGAARNCGIQATSGEFVAFLDADDLWLPRKNETQWKYLVDHSDVSLISGLKWWWDTKTDRRWLAGMPGGTQAIRRNIFIRNTIGNPSMVMLRRRALDEVGLFTPHLRWGEDWELWIRLANRFGVSVLSDPVILYRWRPTGLSHEEEWNQFESQWRISKQSINESKTGLHRLLMLARAWSKVSLERASYALENNFSKQSKTIYAVESLLVFPFEDFFEKCKMLFRSLVGEKNYKAAGRLIKPGFHKTERGSSGQDPDWFVRE